MIVKKKISEDGRYEIVKDIVTFETPNKDLLERVASESSNLLTTEKHTQRNAPENFETKDLAQIKFELEVRDYFWQLTVEIVGLVDCEYGVQLISGKADESEKGQLLMTSGSSIKNGEKRSIEIDQKTLGKVTLFTVWFVTTIEGKKQQSKSKKNYLISQTIWRCLTLLVKISSKGN